MIVGNILIVGGAQGIGRSTVFQLLNAGSGRVIVADRNKNGLDNLIEECHTQGLQCPEVLTVDIRNRTAVDELVDCVEAHYGDIEALIITAGMHSTYPIEYISDEHIETVLDVNLVAPIILIRKILPIVRREGKIILVSSIAASIGVPMSSIYSATKAGIERAFESFAAEIKYRNIHPVIIQPGNVNTGFNETGNTFQNVQNQAVDASYARVVKGIDSKKGVSPDFVASKIVKVLVMSRPKLHYVVGLNAQKAYWAIRILGRNVAVKLMARYFGF